MAGSLKFEAVFSRLEELVRRLEKGDLALEESLKVFEEGVRLSRHCEKMLHQAEKRVELLIRDKEGRPNLHPYEMTALSSPEEEVKEK